MKMVKKHQVRIALLGQPGCGKGTIGSLLEKALGIARLSTGELIRDEIKAGSAFGREVEAGIRSGELVSDEIIVKMVAKMLREKRFAKGVLYDGIPRTEEQVLLMKKRRINPHMVIFLNAPKAVLVERLSNRRECPKDHAVYNLRTNPPKREGVCDKDGSRLIQRPDDTPKVIQKRLDTYRTQTRGLVDLFRDEGILKKVDATGTPSSILKRALNVLPVEMKERASRAVGG